MTHCPHVRLLIRVVLSVLVASIASSNNVDAAMLLRFARGKKDGSDACVLYRQWYSVAWWNCIHYYRRSVKDRTEPVQVLVFLSRKTIKIFWVRNLLCWLLKSPSSCFHSSTFSKDIRHVYYTNLRTRENRTSWNIRMDVRLHVWNG